MITIVLDTETTGLLLPRSAELSKQPRIIELALARIVDGEITAEFEWLIYPECELPKTITKITGLKDEDLKGKPTFSKILKYIEAEFRGADQLIAHNASFDVGMIEAELQRLSHKDFPWPKQTTCTVQEYIHLKGRRLKMTELYQIKLDKKLAQKHRAMDDVRALCEIVIKEGLA